MTSTMQTGMNSPADNQYFNVLLFFGIALVILGTLAIMSSTIATIGTVILFGAILLAASIAEFIHAFRARHSKKALLNVLSGVVYLIAGWFTLYNPLAGALSLTLIMSAFFIVSGFVRCFYAIAHREHKTWGWFLFGGIINLILGTMIALGWPITGLWVIGLFVGIEMLTHGIAWIMLSTVVKNIGKAA